MAAPPPQGSSPWPEDVSGDAASAGQRRDRQASEGPAIHSRMPRQQDPVGGASATPWLWLPVALSSLLLVLFVVVINRQQDQARRLGDLLGRVQTLEHSRALERTAVLEQQLRSMLMRLQDQEKLSRQQQQLTQQLQSLQQELQQLRARIGSPLVPPPDAPGFGDEGRRPERPAGVSPQPLP